MKLKKKKEKKDRFETADLAVDLAEPLFLFVRFLFRSIAKLLN